MWFQTLKTRQSVRSFSTKNGQGLVAGLEYTDKKAEVHTLKRETTPLSLEEGAVVAFLSHENGGMSLLAISQCGKGKSCIELRVWDAMSSIGFTAKEIVAQDLQGNIVNEGKFKAIVSLPETLPGAHLSLKVDSLKDFVSLAVSTGLIVVWRFRKVENGTISLELFSVMKSSMTIQDIAFFQSENTSKKGPPSLVVGEPGGVKVYTAAQNNDASSEPDGEAKFVSTLIPFPSSDIGSTVQDIQRSSPSCCILSDSSGRLWYLNPPLLEEIMLPSSKGGHGVFAVQPKHGQAEGWLATIDQGQTVNLFKLSSVIESTDSGLVVQPWHTILSPHPLSTLSFMEPNVLAGASNANKSISLWVGINNIGTSRLESA